jgi:hypothetical protein
MKRFTFALSCSIPVALAACGKQVPSEVQPMLDAIRDDARKVADAAATTCGAQYTSGQFFVSGKSCGVKLLPGQVIVPSIPSPAKGTPLESNPNVVEVETTCNVPMGAATNAHESCGQGLGTLRNAFKPGDFQSGNWSTSEDTCKSSPLSCERVEVPSRMVKDPKSVDLTIVRPMVGGPPGGTVSVKITVVKK